MSRWDASPCSESMESWDSVWSWSANEGAAVLTWTRISQAVIPRKTANIPSFLGKRLLKSLIAALTLTEAIRV